MNYSMEVTVETTDTEADPSMESIEVSRGIITDVMIYPQVYLGGVIKARLYLAGLQLYPLTIGQSYTIIQEPIKIRDRYPTFPRESNIEMRAWAEGSAYVHKIITLVNVIPFTRDMRRVVF